jgi:ketosteroid isomerase-like protein
LTASAREVVRTTTQTKTVSSSHPSIKTSMKPPAALGKTASCDTRVMAASDVVLLRRAWEAFARGDLEAVTEVLDPRVRWHGAGDDEHEDGCRNRDEALAFIRQALADGVRAKALDFRDAGDRVVVLLQTHQPPEWGDQPHPHGEVVTVRDGKVVETIVYPTVHEALAAAGLDV